MKVKKIVSTLVAAGAITMPALSLGDVAGLSDCCSPSGKDMPTHGGNLGNQRYSALTQIHKDNLQRLGPVWRTHVSAVPPANATLGQQTTPVVVDGVIYVDTPSGAVIAVDGKTGQAKWKWQPTAFGTTGTRRGVSVGDGKVFTLAAGNRVVAIDAQTGAQVWAVQPVGPNGQALGNIAKVATVYHDGLVYVGTNDGNRGAAFALRASDGGMAWSFFGGPARGEIFTDVNGQTVDAGASWGPTPAGGQDCGPLGGATPWIHGSLDPVLGMYYVTFGNARSCRSSQDGELRPGDNLFSNSVVAVDLKTGAYKWHFQAIRKDSWDMDNTHSPLLADVRIGGAPRQALYYGSKSGHLFVLDRANGKPLLPYAEKPMPQDARQSNPATQPFPNRLIPDCLVWQKLDRHNIPGDPWRAVPNYNGYQPDANGNLVYTEPNYLDADKAFVSYPAAYGANHRKGCMYDPHWDQPVLSTTSQNGGPNWSSYSFSHRLGTIFVPYAVSPVAHWRGAAANGQRATGQYQTGGVVAVDAATNTVRWDRNLGSDLSHGQGALSTASDLLFIGLQDGNFLAMDAATGRELWRFQTGAGIAAGPITYEIDGEQYVAIFAAGTTIPYGNSVTRGDALWAFKLGGSYQTASGSSEAPTPAPLAIRRPVSGNAVDGATVANTVLLGRSTRTDAAAAQDSTAANGMNPTHLRVPVGTTVTFLNPGAETFPNFPNLKPHCATQYFEGLFNLRLNPGQSQPVRFDQEGEYFFNDCTDPRPTGKIEVFLTPQDVPGALRFMPARLDLGSPTGVFTGVQGVITAQFEIPPGYRADGTKVELITPLSPTPVRAVSSNVAGGGRTLVAQFRKADLDNNVPAGAAVPLTLVANFLHEGVQKQLRATATPQIVK